MIKILGGELKGMKLKVPANGTRPTTVILRRKLFDQYIDWKKIRFIDLCAGTGAMGIEALSRGCSHVIALENNFGAYKYLQDNTSLAKQRLSHNSNCELTVKKIDFIKELMRLSNELLSGNDYFYFDPPYEMHFLYDKLGDVLTSKHERVKDALWWIESDSQKGYSLEKLKEIIPLGVVKVFEQGAKFVVCFSGDKE